MLHNAQAVKQFPFAILFWMGGRGTPAIIPSFPSHRAKHTRSVCQNGVATRPTRYVVTSYMFF